MSEVLVAAPEWEAVVSGPRRTLRVLRWISAAHALAVVVQPMLAGMYLGGDVDAIGIHGINANVASGLGVIQLIAAIVFVWKGRGRSWAWYTALGIALAEQAQIGLGFEGIVAVHIPLGVSIVSMQILVTVWLFRAAAATPRPAKEKAA
jgi:hypothetical protein